MVNGRNQEVYTFYRPHKFDLRLHNILCHAVCFQLLGCLAIRIISNWLVCGIAYDTDSHHSYHSYQQNSIHPKQAECSACSYISYHYDVRNVATSFRTGHVTWVHRITDTVLAYSLSDSTVLCWSHSGCENSLTAKEMDLEGMLNHQQWNAHNQ